MRKIICLRKLEHFSRIILGNSESGDSETDGSVATSYIPTSFSMTTSASLTLRDPATGTRYVQTQLLQVGAQSLHCNIINEKIVHYSIVEFWKEYSF